jgi:hypothetical protein
MFNSLIQKVKEEKDDFSELLVEYNQLLNQAKLFQNSLSKIKKDEEFSPSGTQAEEYYPISNQTDVYLDDNQLNHQYRINMIEKFNKEELLDFINCKNGNVHECLLWCNWDVFNVRLVKYLVDNKILDPFEKTNIYDGSDATNLSFYMHCKLLKDDINSNYGKNENWYKTSQITDYLKCILKGVCTDRIF